MNSYLKYIVKILNHFPNKAELKMGVLFFINDNPVDEIIRIIKQNKSDNLFLKCGSLLLFMIFVCVVP